MRISWMPSAGHKGSDSSLGVGHLLGGLLPDDRELFRGDDSRGMLAAFNLSH
jgi:hypothetical protein